LFLTEESEDRCLLFDRIVEDLWYFVNHKDRRCGRVCVAAFRPYRATVSLCRLSQGCALGYVIAPRWGFGTQWHASREGAISP
jgi:hypothetical protein